MIIGLWEMFSREVWIDSISLICKCKAPRSDWDQAIDQNERFCGRVHDILCILLN